MKCSCDVKRSLNSCLSNMIVSSALICLLFVSLYIYILLKQCNHFKSVIFNCNLTLATKVRSKLLLHISSVCSFTVCIQLELVYLTMVISLRSTPLNTFKNSISLWNQFNSFQFMIKIIPKVKYYFIFWWITISCKFWFYFIFHFVKLIGVS